jgi:hypothetical protein
MRGALISTLSSPPEVTELDEPQAGSGEILVSIQAVALNPLDVNVGSGRVYLFGDGRGVTAPGFMAERVALPSELPLALPDGVDPGLAAAARKRRWSTLCSWRNSGSRKARFLRVPCQHASPHAPDTDLLRRPRPARRGLTLSPRPACEARFVALPAHSERS